MQFTVTLDDDAYRAAITGLTNDANAEMQQTVPDPNGATEEVRVGGTDEEPVMETRPVMVPNPALYPNPEAYMIARNGDLARNYKQQWEARHPTAPAPTPTPPATGEVMAVTRKQGLKALLRATEVGLPGPVLESQILATINDMPETTTAQKVAKYDTLYEFENAKTWVYDNPFTAGMVAMLGFNETQKRALFDMAATFTE